jgi:hypothetical protein
VSFFEQKDESTFLSLDARRGPVGTATRALLASVVS